MNFSEIEKKDCLALAEFLNTLRGARLPDADLSTMVRFTDGLRWLQDLAAQIAKVYADEQNPTPVAKKDTFTIKEYHPGEVAAAAPIKKKGKKI